MSFNAHDLKVAFQDGREFENERILALLHTKIVTDENNGDQQNQYRYYEKLLKI